MNEVLVLSMQTSRRQLLDVLLLGATEHSRLFDLLRVVAGEAFVGRVFLSNFEDAKTTIEVCSPDIVVIDIDQEPSSAIHLLIGVKTHFPSVCVFGAITHYTDETFGKLYRKGIDDVLMYSDFDRDLLEAIQCYRLGRSV